MHKTGKYLPLHPKRLAEKVGGQWDIDELDRNFLPEFPIGAMCKVHSAHAPSSEQAIQLVRANASAWGNGARIVVRVGHSSRKQLLGLTCFDERSHFLHQRVVALAQQFNQHRPTVFVRRKHLMEDVFCALPPIKRFVHG
jgi:hypothetical protein